MTEVTFRRYSIPSEKPLGGWGIIVIGSDGFFATVSDYGNYAYHWTNTGTSDFRNFLLDIESDYLAKKLSPEKYRTFSPERTEKNIRGLICRKRRDGKITKDYARDQWYDLSIKNELDFQQWMNDTQCDYLYEEELDSYEMGSDLAGFVQRLFPRFQELLRKELAEEKILNSSEGIIEILKILT